MLQFVFSLLGFNIVRGYCEGMTFRFDLSTQNYHRLRLLEICLLALFAIACYKLQFSPVSISGLFFILGSVILSWQLFESAYSYSKYKELVPDRENILGTGRVLTGIYVILLTIIRFVISITLLIFGGLV